MNSLDSALRYRYPGVKPFTTEEHTLFFGRDKDINALFSLIYIKQIVVLYGKSGDGKSSLINAGVIPKLQREAKFVYFPIRFNNYSEKDRSETISPTETVRGRLNVNLTSIVSPLDSLIAQENSFWYWIKTYQWLYKKNKFILFFDQFEELFTYPKDQIDEFSALLAQLLYSTISASFEQRIMEKEEFYQLNDELNNFLYEKPDIKVVFTVRSDRLSLLNGLADRHPAILKNCFELKVLNRLQAISAIEQPAQIPKNAGYNSPNFSYTSDAVEAILDKIASPQDGKIELSTLQIVCRYIEEEFVLQENKLLISQDDLGNINDIFQQYYEGVLLRLSEDYRKKAQYLIEDQLIDDSRRNPLSESYILHRFNINSDLLSQLEKSSLLRKERDANGRLLYEISHDTLISAIERVATSRRSEEKEIKNKELEREIEYEKLRVIQFQKLTEDSQRSEQKAVRRSKIAIILTITLFISTITIVYFYIRSEELKQKTTNITIKFLLAVNKANYKQAENEQQKAFREIEIRNHSKAIEYFNRADSLLSANLELNNEFKNTDLEAYPLVNSSQDIKLKDEINQQRIQLKNEISQQNMHSKKSLQKK